MLPKIKGISLAVLAIVAMSMVAASAVQASELHVTSSANTSIFGERLQQDQQHTFTTAGGAVQCTQSLFEGTLNGSGVGQQTTANSLTTTATYTGCTAFFLGATVNLNGCKYNVTGAGQPALTAVIDVVGCTSGKVIEIKAALGCTVTVPEQTGLSHIVFQNKPEPGAQPHDVTAQVTVQGITYEGHGCEFVGIEDTVLTHDGEYVGQATFRARQDVAAQQATHNSHQYQKLGLTGALVGLIGT